MRISLIGTLIAHTGKFDKLYTKLPTQCLVDNESVTVIDDSNTFPLGYYLESPFTIVVKQVNGEKTSIRDWIDRLIKEDLFPAYKAQLSDSDLELDTFTFNVGFKIEEDESVRYGEAVTTGFFTTGKYTVNYIKQNTVAAENIFAQGEARIKMLGKAPPLFPV